jgi:hypothetical protein
MENRLKRKLADGALTFCPGVNQARTPNITARADIDRMRTIPVPRI